MDSADDLVQEACERALRKGNWGDSDHVDRWMFRTIRNLHVDHLRHLQVAERYKGRVLQEETASMDGEKMLERELQLEEVHAAVGSLSEEQRTTMLLVCIEGFSYREVAEILDLPIGTVTSRLARARNSVLAFMESNTGSGNGGREVADG
jgi:RNA polymerase sigma-70 factor (ECF subfamily)